jgi:geranylgeranyl diphosphate synthase type II
MDKADVRRGKKTVHKVWNDNVAVLSGDAMLILAYRYIMDCPSEYMSKVLNLFNKTILEICEGQQYDMDFEQRNNVTEAEYIEMIRLKTSVLLAASLKIGAMLGGAPDEDMNNLYNFGIQLGIAFQLKDDFLDVYGDSAVFGKSIGGDILYNKKTYMLIKAFEYADKSQTNGLGKWLKMSQYNPQEKIVAVTNIYNQLGIKEFCEDKMSEYYRKALKFLGILKITSKKKTELENLAWQLMYREL